MSLLSRACFLSLPSKVKEHFNLATDNNTHFCSFSLISLNLYYFVINVIIPAMIADNKGNIIRLPTHFFIFTFTGMYGIKSSVPGINHAFVCPTQYSSIKSRSNIFPIIKIGKQAHRILIHGIKSILATSLPWSLFSIQQFYFLSNTYQTSISSLEGASHIDNNFSISPSSR